MKRKEIVDETKQEKEEVSTEDPSSHLTSQPNKKPKVEETEEKEEQKSTENEKNGTEQKKTSELSEDEKKKLKESIKTQIEFYFSDSNLPGDKFLKGAIAAHPEGYVSLERIASFNRIKKMTTDIDLIKEALSDSTELLLSDDKQFIKRVTPLSIDNETILKRTVFVSNYPTENETVDTATEFFSQFGTVKCVRLLHRTDRQTNTKILKGHVFVEFSTEEEANKLVETKEEIKKGSNVLKIKHKEERQPKNENQKKNKKQKGNNDNNNKEEEEENEEKDKSNNNNRPVVRAPGTVISVKNIPTDIDKFTLAGHFEKFGKVRFSDLKDGNSEGYIRMDNAEDAQKVIKETADNKIKIKDNELELKIIEGKDEEDYWTNVNNLAQKRKRNTRGRNRGGKRRRK